MYQSHSSLGKYRKNTNSWNKVWPGQPVAACLKRRHEDANTLLFMHLTQKMERPSKRKWEYKEKDASNYSRLVHGERHTSDRMIQYNLHWPPSMKGFCIKFMFLSIFFCLDAFLVWNQLWHLAFGISNSKHFIVLWGTWGTGQPATLPSSPRPHRPESEQRPLCRA